MVLLKNIKSALAMQTKIDLKREGYFGPLSDQIMKVI